MWTKLLVSMGDYASPGACRIVRVDLAQSRAETVVEWLPPEPLRAASKGFTGMAWSGAPGTSDLITCCHAAVCRIDPQTWDVTGVLHQPCMNDLHGLTVADGRILVTNTGLDRVETFTLQGEFVGGWDLSPAWVAAARLGGTNPSESSFRRALHPGWSSTGPAPLEHEPFPQRFDPLIDPSLGFSVRKVRDFVHPNSVAVVGGRPIVTRFLDRSIQDLTDWSLVVPRTPGHPHDGVAYEDRFFVTCVQGFIGSYAIERGRITAKEIDRIDLYERTGCSGWCRGLLVTAESLVVTLSQIHQPPRYAWSDRPFDETETSLLVLDRETLQLTARIDLRPFGQATKAFGVLPLA